MLIRRPWKRAFQTCHMVCSGLQQALFGKGSNPAGLKIRMGVLAQVSQPNQLRHVSSMSFATQQHLSSHLTSLMCVGCAGNLTKAPPQQLTALEQPTAHKAVTTGSTAQLEHLRAQRPHPEGLLGPSEVCHQG
mgnify:FL=1